MADETDIDIDWSIAIGDLDSSEGFTNFFFKNRSHMIEQPGDRPLDVKRKTALRTFFNAIAVSKGFKWNKETRQYTVAPKQTTALAHGRSYVGY